MMRAIAVVLTLVLGACGGGDDGGDDGGGGPVAPPPDGGSTLRVQGGGNNVADRFTSDLWVHGAWAYTGTWGGFPRNETAGNAVKIWALDGQGAPTLADSIVLPQIATVSDVEVSGDGQVLMFSTEGGLGAGLYLYSLADPTAPVFLDSVSVSTGVHTATFGTIAGRRYAFAAKDPEDPALLIYDVTDPGAITPVAQVPVPPLYGIHDTFVRDGIAFVFAWNTGVIIYDVGSGVGAGSPAAPQEVGRLVTANDGLDGSRAHSGWWFHSPVRAERRYLFVCQEGPGTIGSQSSGDVHVVDVSDLAHPTEVAFFTLGGAGAHNVWMDEDRAILYVSYYNAGVVALDVSGTLSGNLSSRLISRLAPGGAGSTYTWGVQLAGGSVYASDMLSGLWQLRLEEEDPLTAIR